MWSEILKLIAKFVAIMQFCQLLCHLLILTFNPILRAEIAVMTDKNARISDILAEFPLFSISVAHIGMLINILA